MRLIGRTRIVGVIVTPAKYVEVPFGDYAFQRRKVMPAQGYTRRQREKDRKTHIVLSKIKREKRRAARRWRAA